MHYNICVQCGYKGSLCTVIGSEKLLFYFTLTEGIVIISETANIFCLRSHNKVIFINTSIIFYYNDLLYEWSNTNTSILVLQRKEMGLVTAYTFIILVQ